MQYILYGVLGIYSLPLIGVAAAALFSGFFSHEIEFVYLVGAISNSYINLLRDSFGTMVVPLVTAFSIEVRSSGQIVPKRTKILFTYLVLMFLLSISFFGIVSIYEERLTKY